MDDVPTPPPHVLVRPVGSVSVTVPEVATTVSDGFPAAVQPGQRRWSVPALLTVGSTPRDAWLEVNGTSCPAVPLASGEVVRLACSSLVKPHSTVTVALQTAGGTIATWRHTVR